MLVEKLKEIGFRVMIVSNNCEERVKTFSDALGASYIYKADKPSMKGYVEAMNKMGCKRDQMLVIGDQLFTDDVNDDRGNDIKEQRDRCSTQCGNGIHGIPPCKRQMNVWIFIHDQL